MSTPWVTRRILDWECELFRPSSRETPHFGLLYLHDEDGENQLHGHEALLEKHQLTVLVPQCGPCWWMDKIVPAFHDELTPQDYLTQHVVELGRELGLQRLGLLGIGMGGQGVLKLAYARPSEFPVVAAICPMIDFHQLLREPHPVLSDVFENVEAARQYTPILHVHPLNWPRFEFFCCDPEDYWAFEGADRLRMKLGSIGIPFECDLQTTTGGDRQAYLDQMLPPTVTYVTEKLDEHRRSLI